MVVRLCISKSTAHGLGNIGNEPERSGKILWLLLTIITIMIFMFHTYLLYEQLQEEQILVSTQRFATRFIQPDIVFCSDRIFARDFINYPPENEYEYMYNVSKNIQKFNKLYQKSKYRHTSVIWNSLNLHQLYKAFYHRKHELFLRITCNLKDIDFDLSSVKVEMNYLYFACYRFNSSLCRLKTPFDNLVVKFYTYIYGVNITYSKLNVLVNNKTIDTYLFHQSDAIDEMEDGIHVYFPQENHGVSSHLPKVTAAVNTHTYIKIKSKKFIRLPTKRFQCQKQETFSQIYNLLEENILSNPLNVSECSLCIQTNFQEKLYSYLHCVSSQFPISKNIPSNFSFCGNITKRSKFFDYMKFWKITGIIEPIMIKCKTKVLCTTVHHHAVANYNNWPRKFILRKLFKHDIPRKLKFIKLNNMSSPGLEEALSDFKRNSSNMVNWKRNFIKVSISPGEFRSTVVEESLQYSLKNFFSDVGGIMGLYMGASLLTLFEVFRLFHYTIHSKVQFRQKNRDIEANSASEH